MTFYWWSHWFWITLIGHILLYITIVETYPSREISLEYKNKNTKTFKPITKLFQTTTFSWTISSSLPPPLPQYSVQPSNNAIVSTLAPMSQNLLTFAKRGNLLTRSVEVAILDDDYIQDVNETEDEIEEEVDNNENKSIEFEFKRSAEEFNKTKLIIDNLQLRIDSLSGDNLKNQLSSKINKEKVERKNQQISVLKSSNKLKREQLTTYLDNYTNFSSAANDGVIGINKIGSRTATAATKETKSKTSTGNITKEAITLTQTIAPISKISGSKFEAHSSTAAEFLINVNGASQQQQHQQQSQQHQQKSLHTISYNRTSLNNANNNNNDNKGDDDNNDDDANNNDGNNVNLMSNKVHTTISQISTTNTTSSSSIQKVPFILENVNKEDELRRAENEHRSRKSKVLSAEYRHINRYINFSTDSKSVLARSAASTAPSDFYNDEGNISSEALSIQRTYFLDAGAILAICFTVFGICCTIGTIGIVLYRRRYLNKPQTLSEPDSSVYIDDSTMRDNSDEMYSLDNDSFLNSLEAMTIQNYWTDTVKHTKL